MRSRYSTTVTSAPRRAQTEPISRPITPAPIRMRRLGTDFSDKAPVLVTMRSSSTSIPGREVGSEPVAITMFLVSSVRVDPSSSVASTLPLPRILPRPFTYSTLFFLNKYSMPCVSPPTASSFWAIIWSRSSSTLPVLMPIFANWFCALSKYSDACSNALDGIHPTLRQVPPSTPRDSIHATLRPSWPALIAQL